MSDTTVNDGILSQVAESMRPALRDYAGLLKDLVGDNLVGLTVFGAVLSGEFDATRMTAGSVLVLERVDLDLLRRVASHGPKLGSKRITAPLIMTPAYISSSRDSFPLELLEIHQRHVTLLGKDCFETVAIEPEHLRLQCEREFKRILMRLRQGLLAAAGRDRVLGELELNIGQHLLRTLRGLLWLKGHKEPLPGEEVLAESEKLTDKPLPGVRGAIHLYGEHGWNEFTALYEDVERLAAVADAL